MAHPRGTHSRYVIGCCLIPLGICGFENNSRRITYGIGRVWGMPSLSPLSSLVLTHFSRIERTKTTLTCSQRPNIRYDSFLKCRNYAETTNDSMHLWTDHRLTVPKRRFWGQTTTSIYSTKMVCDYIGRNGRTFADINELLRRTSQAWMRRESGI